MMTNSTIIHTNNTAPAQPELAAPKVRRPSMRLDAVHQWLLAELARRAGISKNKMVLEAIEYYAASAGVVVPPELRGKK